MTEKKQKNPLFAVIIIVVVIMAIGSRFYKYSKNKEYERQAQQQQMNQIRQEQKNQAKIDDKIIVPETKTTDAQETAQQASAHTESTAQSNKLESTKEENEKAITLSPYIKFIGHVHTGRRTTVGPTPAMNAEKDQFAMLTVPYAGKENGVVELALSDIENVTDRKIHHGTGLQAKDAVALHKTTSITLDNTYSQNILSLTALSDGNWLWLKGNPYEELDFKKAPQAELATCWFTWSGQENDTPHKTCLDASQERGELLSVSTSQNGSVGLFVQREKTKEVKGDYNEVLSFAIYRLLAVDLKTGQLVFESSINHATEKKLELGASFLDAKGTQAIIYESLEPENRSESSLNLYVWDISNNRIVGDTQILGTIESDDPTKISNSRMAPDGKSVQLVYGRGANQIVIDTESGLVKSHSKYTDYSLSTSDPSSEPRARSGFPLANGNVLFIVSDRSSNHSWQIFNQDTKDLLGQQVETRLGLKLLYPYGRMAIHKSSSSFLYEIYEVQD